MLHSGISMWKLWKTAVRIKLQQTLENFGVKVTITNNTFGQNPAGNDAIGLYYIADAGITAYNNTFASEEPTIYICSASISPSISQEDAIAMFTAKK